MVYVCLYLQRRSHRAIHLCPAHGVLSGENGKVKHKVVQNLGRLDILSQSDPNYLENLKKKYQEDYVEKNRLQSLNRLAQVQNLLSFDNNSSAALRSLCCSTGITS